MTEQQRTIDEIRRRAAGSVGQYGGDDVAFLLDALEGALASIRWRDALAEEWSAHTRALVKENARQRRLLTRVVGHLATGIPTERATVLRVDILNALDMPPPTEHTYKRGDVPREIADVRPVVETP
jgi:hypothetical protein